MWKKLHIKLHSFSFYLGKSRSLVCNTRCLLPYLDLSFTVPQFFYPLYCVLSLLFKCPTITSH